ncbi:MAG: hypothetical protein PVG73_13680, partial [Desulfobacterales bacterium]
MKLLTGWEQRKPAQFLSHYFFLLLEIYFEDNRINLIDNFKMSISCQQRAAHIDTACCYPIKSLHVLPGFQQELSLFLTQPQII